MLIYVVIGIKQGAVDQVGATLDYSDVLSTCDTLAREYGIASGQEEESENEVVVREVEVEEIPASVLARRAWW